MSAAARYLRSEQLTQDGDITTSRGVDQVTGLAVLIYDFPFPPRARPGRPEVDGLPTVLAASFEEGRGTLVTAYPSGATLVAPGEAVVDDQFVLQSLTTLRDCARAKLVHGDLSSGRFLWTKGRVLLEGYGVPWGKPAQIRTEEELRVGLANDLRSAVAALLELSRDGVSSEVLAALQGASGERPNVTDAAQLQGVIRRLAGGAVTVPAAGFGDIVLPSLGSAKPPSAKESRDTPSLDGVDLDAVDFSTVPVAPRAGVDFDEQDVAGSLGGAPSVSLTRTDMRVEPEVFERKPPPAPAAPTTGPIPSTDPDPITLTSDPGLTVPPDKADGAATTGFVKAPPPGATYRVGNLDESMRAAPIRLDVRAVTPSKRRAYRGPLLLSLLLAITIFASYLAVLSQRASRTEVVGGTVGHVVDVQILPNNLPPVSLVVSRSPSGSAYSAGTIIASVPRRVRFDANGQWTVHATFQGRRSEPLSFTVPDDTVIVLNFPTADDGTGP